ncbi:Anthranilate phosphoribosyltransferase [Smittium mucronatum]|uniref:Anthranilate phosphoribosyltransferase n=1 Tax=Smittium mucronatum TaxID=133383 RepID=A0A1R0GZV0_9FUNG|nr:Anthranilate phosphoribosyltransferase [Smittium mucronatum]
MIFESTVDVSKLIPMREIVKKLINDENGFTEEHARHGLHSIFLGESTEAQQGAFLTALRLRGIDRRPDILYALAQEMYSKAIRPKLVFESGQQYVVDIVGTGGDGWNTFNVSTASSIVVAGAGLRHGSRSSSSNCGSADLLENVGCNLDGVLPENVNSILNQSNFCFLFSRSFHPSMGFLAKARREIGFPTPFNILGPLTNPTDPKYAVIGVHSLYLGPIMADTLVRLGKRNHWVVCAELGMDEISIEGSSHVWEIDGDGNITHKIISPADFGLPEYPISLASSSSLELNTEILDALLSGNNTTEREKAIRTFVLLNSAALLYVSKAGPSLKECVKLAAHSIDSGNAKRQLELFAKSTQHS